MRVYMSDDVIEEHLSARRLAQFGSALLLRYHEAGGVPCHPELSLMQITPISPHHPRMPALVVPPGSRISVETLDAARRPVRAVADGVDTCRVARLEVTLEQSGLSIAFFDKEDFTQRLVAKLLRN